MQLRVSRADREAERDEVVETCKRQETENKLRESERSHIIPISRAASSSQAALCLIPCFHMIGRG